MYIPSRIVIFSIIISLSFLSTLCKKETSRSYHTPCTKLDEGPVTLYIHGTIFPIISHFTRHHTERKGLYRYTQYEELPKRTFPLGWYLHKADPKNFIAKNFYKYYWSGQLSSKERKKAAQEIYELIKNHTEPLTIIAHSHGCNVALYLGQLLQENTCCKTINKLILLAPPVQSITADLISSPSFKRVYNFYSHADFMQVADPQQLYLESRTSGKKEFFSQRIYPATDNLSQVRIVKQYRGPSHRDFIHPNFFMHIPALLVTADLLHTKGKKNVTMNIPHKGQPSIVNEPAKKGKPRGFYRCTCKDEKHTKRS